MVVTELVLIPMTFLFKMDKIEKKEYGLPPRKITNKNNLPRAIMNALHNDPYTKGNSDISTTQLIKPVRIVKYEKEYKYNITEDASDLIFSLVGQSVHHIIERAVADNDIAERRLYCEINGWSLSGQFDLLTTKKELIDFKVTSAWSTLDALKNGKSEWEQQLNVLDYLAYKNQYDVDTLSIMAILRDWSKLKALTSTDYPKQQVVMIPIKRWTRKEQQNFIEKRIKLHQLADSAKANNYEHIPVCTPKERWRKEDKYAIMKNGRKTALRVLDNKNQVKQYLKDKKLIEGKGCTVVFRAGEDTRCKYYCNVNKFCNYYKEESVEF